MATDTLVLDGVTFRVSHVNAKIARRMMVLGAKVLGGAIMKGLSEVQAAAIMVSEAPPEAIDWIADELAKVSTVQLNSSAPVVALDVTYDDAFKGKHMRHFRWLKFALEYNFADFFADAGNTLPGGATGNSSVSPLK